MSKLTAVVIGCGAIAREHLAALQDVKGVEVGGVCDLSPARAEATAERFGVANWDTDYENLLDRVRPDLVHITTPPASHFPIANCCLTHRLNVLCEKPVTVEYAQFKLLKQLAIDNDCVFLENQNLRYHSSIRRLLAQLDEGAFGELLDVQVFFALNLLGPGSPYTDRNSQHFGLSLKGGIIGDFLPHIAYLTRMFVGSVSDLRTQWLKRTADSPLPADEFRGFIKGEHAPAYVGFSANSQVSGYWLRLTGTLMSAEANLLDPPRVTFRRYRTGEPAIGNLVDGLAEARGLRRGTIGAFWRKLAGTSSYDGLPEMVSETYRALATKQPQPVSLEEIDAVAQLVDQFTAPAVQL